MTWKLKAISAELDGKEVSIDKDMLVGRHQEADILLQSAEISRRHAAFLVKDDALWIQDLKSSNGTFVNDIRIDEQKLLKDSDIVQFASLKFHVYAPAVQTVVSETVASVVTSERISPEVVVEEIVQPAEAIATSEVQQPVVEEKVITEKTAAEKMNEQGMPELSSRDEAVQLSRDGMPTNVSVPKPAPIPAHVDIHAPASVPEACEIKTPDVCVEKEVETQKNAKVGLITIITLVILAVIAWLFFK
ncbi:FHA domain-containing protein [Acinetobacter sp. CFCC 10889]|uniref:FHA domain-containing protein n=1 Tax=Acinetobacter sp. CFCC 10889 TaxID=1775557 RepID=UPI000DD0BC7C|nr:FHA domain-containing protein [Acinetobacter sp. CFCC 10889]